MDTNERILTLANEFRESFLGFEKDLLANNRKEWLAKMQSIADLNVLSTYQKAKECIEKMESNIRDEVLILLKSEVGEGDYGEIIAEVVPKGCLRIQMDSRVNSIMNSLEELKSTAQNFRDTIKKNSGVLSGVWGFYKGIISPKESASYLFGRGPMQLEVKKAQQDFDSKAKRYYNEVSLGLADIGHGYDRVWDQAMSKLDRIFGNEQTSNFDN